MLKINKHPRRPRPTLLYYRSIVGTRFSGEVWKERSAFDKISKTKRSQRQFKLCRAEKQYTSIMMLKLLVRTDLKPKDVIWSKTPRWKKLMWAKNRITKKLTSNLRYTKYFHESLKLVMSHHFQAFQSTVFEKCGKILEVIASKNYNEPGITGEC